jgi:hypothetical protein
MVDLKYDAFSYESTAFLIRSFVYELINLIIKLKVLKLNLCQDFINKGTIIMDVN